MRVRKNSHVGRRKQQLSAKASHRWRDRLEAMCGSARRQSSESGPILRRRAIAEALAAVDWAGGGRYEAMSGGKSKAPGGKG